MLFFLAALVTAPIDWLAVRFEKPHIELVAKPLVMVLLIAATLTTTTEPGEVKWLLAAGLLGGLVGDIALLPRFDQFLVGLGSFLVGHLFYVAAFLAFGFDPAMWFVATIIAAALTVGIGRPIIKSVHTSRLRWPVVAYVVVIGAMVVTGLGTGEPFFALGAVLFALSDGLLGTDRFVTPRIDRRVWVHLLYHSAQILFVAAIL